MRNKLLDLAAREHSPRRRMAALIAEGFVFIVGIPLLLVRGSARLDRRLHLPRLQCGPLNQVAGALFAVVGWPLAMWAIVTQFTQGRGTPVPVMATQKLLTQGPYAVCRNPMALGAILAYLGISLWRGSPSAVGAVLLLSAQLLAYIKLGEEREMVARFGQEYEAYRRSVPFLIPRLSAAPCEPAPLRAEAAVQRP